MLRHPLTRDLATRRRRLRQGWRSRTSTNQFGPSRGANPATMPAADSCSRTVIIADRRARWLSHQARVAGLPE
jgi:hypothetical protein